MLPHIANLVSNDCLFSAFAVLWFTQLLWILNNPSTKLLLFHSVVLLLIFAIRSSAFFLPFISIGAILLASIPKKLKLMGVGSIALLLLLFIGRTQYEYKIKTGTVQFSAFGSWQLVANALYAYAHARPDSNYVFHVTTWDLHAIVNQHMDSLRSLAQRPDEEIGDYYLWDVKSPLRVNISKNDDKLRGKSFFQKWSFFAPMYIDYGKHLIIKHPGLYIKYFVWPNLSRFYAPPANSMEYYNLGLNTVDPIAVKWFDWKNNQLPTRNTERKIKIMSVFPNAVAILNSFFLIFSFTFAVWVGFKNVAIATKKILCFALIVWWTNLIFTALTAPIELQQELFSIIIMIPFAVIFLEGVIHSLQPTTTKSPNLSKISIT